MSYNLDPKKMTEEEYFRKNYPDSCYGDKPLSPHWDFFQDGVELGERQSEKKIAELEKENKELKCECRRCVYTDSPCVLSDYGKDKNGMCDHFKDVFEENTKLNVENAFYEKACEGATMMYEHLTKAKEIIKKYLAIGVGGKITQNHLDVTKEAKQFLKK